MNSCEIKMSITKLTLKSLYRHHRKSSLNLPYSSLRAKHNLLNVFSILPPNAVSIKEHKRFTGLLVYSKFSFVVARRHLVATVTSVSVSHALNGILFLSHCPYQMETRIHGSGRKSGWLTDGKLVVSTDSCAELRSVLLEEPTRWFAIPGVGGTWWIGWRQRFCAV